VWRTKEATSTRNGSRAAPDPVVKAFASYGDAALMLGELDGKKATTDECVAFEVNLP